MKSRFRMPLLSLGLLGHFAFLVSGQLPAQTFRVLHTFGGSGDGANPAAGLVLSANILYGTTEGGGSLGNGTIFAVNTDGTGFTVLHTFTGGSDGTSPAAPLVLSGKTLYGTTTGGGISSNGTVFAVNIDGTGFTNLYSFTALSGPLSTNSDGASPQDGLVLAANTLYGTARAGGSAGNGSVFAINTDGTGFKTLYSFTPTPFRANGDGANPNGLTLSSNVLYGTTERGGALGGGTVFAINIDGTSFTNLHSFPYVDLAGGFDNNSDGSFPKGVILSGNILYGTARYGGAAFGTLFRVNTDGTGFAVMRYFTPSGNDGAYPSGGLVSSDGVIFGIASGWRPPSGFMIVATTNHTVFKVDTDGTAFANLYDFDKPSGYPPINSDGAYVYGGLILSNNTLYGAAFEGGSLGNGTLFSFAFPFEFAYIRTNDAITITKYVGYQRSIAIPDTIDGVTVTRIGDNAFSGLIGLVSVTIPNSVNELGQNAFFGCSGLTNVAIGNGVSNIGSSAFESCSGLNSISLPDSLLNIGSSAFLACSGLTNVTIPNSVTNIADFAFQSCTNLATFTIPSSVVGMGPESLSDCTGLTAIRVDALNPVYSSVEDILFDKSQTTLIQFPAGKGGAYTIPSTVTTIMDSAFSSCTGLTDLEIPDSVIQIGDYAFANCNSLTNVTIPHGLTSIGAFTFEFCGSLSSITMPEGITNIGIAAFQYCTSLTAITIPNSVSNIGIFAFYYCTNLNSAYFTGITPSADPSTFAADNNATIYYMPGSAGWGTTFYGVPAIAWDPHSQTEFGYTTNRGTITITFYPGSNNVVTIPATINGLLVTSIGDFAFYKNPDLITVSLPNNVTNIGDYAFQSCTNLSIAAIPDSVTSIGEGAFQFCLSLTNIDIPDNVLTIGDYAFSFCSNLTTVSISSGLASIGGNAFNSCLALASIGIPNSVTNIGDYAFTLCSSLTNATISYGVTSIGVGAFQFCSRLTDVDVPGSVVTIGDYAFYLCTNLTTFTIASGVTSLGTNALNSCVALASIAIPNSVTNIGDSAFAFCTSLTNAIIPNSLSIIAPLLFTSCTRLSSITIPNSITRIGDAAFAGSGITKITVPNSVTNIGGNAFGGCSSLTTVTLGSAVSEIGGDSFAYCSSLTGIYFEGNLPISGETPFFLDWNATIYYLPGTTGWGAIFDGWPALPTLLWNAHVETADGSFGLLANQFGFNIIGTTNIAVVVEANTTLATTAWSPIGTFTLTNGFVYFTDPQWTNYPARFYRLRWP